MVQGCTQAKAQVYLKITKAKRAGGIAQVEADLASVRPLFFEATKDQNKTKTLRKKFFSANL
jgi:hypothetical protein